MKIHGVESQHKKLWPLKIDGLLKCMVYEKSLPLKIDPKRMKIYGL